MMKCHVRPVPNCAGLILTHNSKHRLAYLYSIYFKIIFLPKEGKDYVFQINMLYAYASYYAFTSKKLANAPSY